MSALTDRVATIAAKAREKAQANPDPVDAAHDWWLVTAPNAGPIEVFMHPPCTAAGMRAIYPKCDVEAITPDHA